MNNSDYGPLAFLIGTWNSLDWTGMNRAPDPDRRVENTNFKQEMIFVPIGEINNHEQSLFGLRYSTKAWEKDGDDSPFHEEVGYWLWDPANKQVIKSFIVPRGVSVLAGGTTNANSTSFEVTASAGSETYGICSNHFLNAEFKSVWYELKIEQQDANSFSYDEDTHLKIKAQAEIFHHTEKNTMIRKK